MPFEYEGEEVDDVEVSYAEDGAALAVGRVDDGGHGEAEELARSTELVRDEAAKQEGIRAWR
ncbi:hypothetical protein JAO29_16605 [Edaphobacter sp. HDX4]|uniref:hypothetical protein n=1 Tax=Edaphobacter sp. HDX4 TaxID=2794064 RepID=UPI002FE51CE1